VHDRCALCHLAGGLHLLPTERNGSGHNHDPQPGSDLRAHQQHSDRKLPGFQRHNDAHANRCSHVELHLDVESNLVGGGELELAELRDIALHVAVTGNLHRSGDLARRENSQ